MSKIYFIGDCHFGHKDIHLKFRKEFSSVEQHDSTIMYNILKRVTTKDVLWMLGDNFISKDSFRYIQIILPMVRQLNIVLGNHEHKDLLPFIYSLGITKDMLNIYGITKKYDAWISHAPVHPDELREKINIHGHVHTNTLKDHRYFNASCENIQYTPISLQEIKYFMNSFRSIENARNQI
ncbi:MAG: hypothetical protein EBR73_17175 [Rhodobacteraceae bacterium]|nr:hypothetical protein [Paracoccaceae bacterium]